MIIFYMILDNNIFDGWDFDYLKVHLHDYKGNAHQLSLNNWSTMFT